MKKETTLKLVLAGLFTALGLIFPTIFHTFGMLGPIFLPMHIPVLLCGMICGYRLGGITGVIVPLLSSALTGMPTLYPVAVYMMCELATYGIVAGFLAKKTNPVLALAGAMITGRIVLAIAQIILLGLGENGFAISAFFTGSFVKAIPGIIIQLIFIPIIVLSIKKFVAVKNLAL